MSHDCKRSFAQPRQAVDARLESVYSICLLAVAVRAVLSTNGPRTWNKGIPRRVLTQERVIVDRRCIRRAHL